MNEKYIAVKQVKKFELWNELDIMKMLPKNRYIVNYIGQLEYKEDPHLYILMELCESSLEDEIKINDGLNLSQFKNLVLCFMNGFKFIRQFNVVHGDIKPGNILILDGKFKLADFGLSCIAPPNQRLSQIGGSYHYCHPKVFKMNFWPQIGIEEPKEKLPSNIDLYSIAVTLFESITGKKPFHAENHKKMYALIKNKKQKHIRGSIVGAHRCYFSWLPTPCSIKNGTLQKRVQSLLQLLLAREEENMISFQQFYTECQDLVTVLNGFSGNSMEN